MKSPLLPLAVAAGLLTTPLAFAQQGKVTKNEKRVPVRVLQVETQKQVRPLETTVRMTAGHRVSSPWFSATAVPPLVRNSHGVL